MKFIRHKICDSGSSTSTGQDYNRKKLTPCYQLDLCERRNARSVASYSLRTSYSCLCRRRLPVKKIIHIACSQLVKNTGEPVSRISTILCVSVLFTPSHLLCNSCGESQTVPFMRVPRIARAHQRPHALFLLHQRDVRDLKAIAES